MSDNAPQYAEAALARRNRVDDLECQLAAALADKKRLEKFETFFNGLVAEAKTRTVYITWDTEEEALLRGETCDELETALADKETAEANNRRWICSYCGLITDGSEMRPDLKALCQCEQGCGKLGPVHVVRSTRIGTRSEQVSEAKLYAAEHCPICKPSEGK